MSLVIIPHSSEVEHSPFKRVVDGSNPSAGIGRGIVLLILLTKKGASVPRMAR